VPAIRYEGQRVTFTVPASTAYAPERITLFPVEDMTAGILGVQILVEATVAACTIELWMAKIGATDLTADASYFLSSNTFSGATAGSTYWPMVSWPAIQLRVKGGSTAGNLIVNATAD